MGNYAWRGGIAIGGVLCVLVFVKPIASATPHAAVTAMH